MAEAVVACYNLYVRWDNMYTICSHCLDFSKTACLLNREQLFTVRWINKLHFFSVFRWFTDLTIFGYWFLPIWLLLANFDVKFGYKAFQNLATLINDFPLTCRRVKHSFIQVVRVRPVRNLKVFQLSPDVDCPSPTVNFNPFSCNGKTQQQNLTRLVQIVYKNAAAVAFYSV